MPERRLLTADERFAALQKDRARLRRQRLQREVAGPVWRRMARIVPALFDRAGVLRAHVLRAERAAVIQALGDDAVLASDTAMRLLFGAGFLAGGDVQAYVASAAPLERLVEAGLIDPAPSADTTIVRPWPGPPRLLVCIVDAMPPWCRTPGGQRVVTPERLRRELIGTVGARADLFALLERAEAAALAPAGVEPAPRGSSR
jgi:hypothetical protein